MKKTLLILSLAFICFIGNTQNIIYDKTKNIHTYSTDKNDTRKLSEHTTLITVEKSNKEAYTIKLKIKEKSDEFTIKPFTYDSFANGIKNSILKMTNEVVDKNKSELQMLFFDLLISRDSEPEAPLAGTLHLEDSIHIGWFAKIKKINQTDTIYEKKSFLKEKFKNDPNSLLRLDQTDIENKILSRYKKDNSGDKITISEISKILFVPKESQIEFTDGYIRNISITGKLIRKDKSNVPLYNKLVFKNAIPIGFSSLKDFNRIPEIKLKSSSKHETTLIQLALSEFLSYHPNLRINTRDYCPTNGTINIQHPIAQIKLYKEEASKILNAKIYTDVLGLQEDNPNGIIQTEVEKKITLWTRRRTFIKGTNLGLIQYAKPYVILSKVEKQNKYLELKEKQNKDSLKVNSLDLMKHEAFRVGTDINLITFDGPSAKSTICWDMGVAFSKVIISDTTTVETAESNKTHINNLNLYTKANIQLFPDERYGINFSYQLNYYSTLNHKVTLLPIKEKQKNKNWIQNMELMAFLKTGNVGKIFFRYRLNSSLTNWDYNFAQVQLGYSFDITKQIK